MLPPANATETNWLRQQALKKAWKTEYMAQLEQKLAQANMTIARQQLTIEALREQVGLCHCSLQPSPWLSPRLSLAGPHTSPHNWQVKRLEVAQRLPLFTAARPRSLESLARPCPPPASHG